MKTKLVVLSFFLAFLLILPSAQAVPLSLDFNETQGVIPAGAETNDGLVPVYGSNAERSGFY
jgi:hypothetical protein